MPKKYLKLKLNQAVLIYPLGVMTDNGIEFEGKNLLYFINVLFMSDFRKFITF